jgi:hypothetical protein
VLSKASLAVVYVASGGGLTLGSPLLPAHDR